MNRFIFSTGASAMEGITLGIILTLSAASAGESSALLVGMNLGGAGNLWLTPSNVAYATSDTLIGGFLAYSALNDRWGRGPVFAALGALALTNTLRAVEYYSDAPNPFCANEALLAVDIAKITLSVTALVLALAADSDP
jgi:hypothetical protein